MMETVYQLIADVMGELTKTGIAKNNKNAAQGYKFRGIDDVINALSPILSEKGLVILPRLVSREVCEKQTKSGGVMFYTTVIMDYDFISIHDGSKHTVTVAGEAMDSGDKSTNKAMSAAYKYAAIQAFCIPTEGDNDADAHSPEVVATRPPAATLEEYADFIANVKAKIDSIELGSDLTVYWKEVKGKLSAENIQSGEVYNTIVDEFSRRKREIIEKEVNQ